MDEWKESLILTNTGLHATPEVWEMRKKQAEVSFKAGYEQGQKDTDFRVRDECQTAIANGNKIAFQAGRLSMAKEIVEWGEEECPHIHIYRSSSGKPVVTMPSFKVKHECRKCWQAKVKEWLEEKK